MGDLLHLLTTRQPLPAHLARAHQAGSPAAAHAACLAHYSAEAELAKLLADLRAELAYADQLMRLALCVMTLQQQDQWGRLADAADLLGPSGGTTRHHERAAVLQRAHHTSTQG